MSIIFSPTPSIRSLSAMLVRIPQMLRLRSTTEKRLRTSSFTALSPVRRLPRTAKNSAVRLSGCLKLMKPNLQKKMLWWLLPPKKTVAFLLKKCRMELGSSVKSKARQVLYSPRKKSRSQSVRLMKSWKSSLSITSLRAISNWLRSIRTTPTTSS